MLKFFETLSRLTHALRQGQFRSARRLAKTRHDPFEPQPLSTGPQGADDLA